MFSQRIADNFTNPTHGGEVAEPALVLESKDPVCGDQIRITIGVTNDNISSARFRAWGCATSVATANILCAWMEGKPVSECAHASAEALADELGELSPEQRHCHEIAVSLVGQLSEKSTA